MDERVQEQLRTKFNLKQKRDVAKSLNQTVEQVNSATEAIDKDSLGFFMLWGVVFSLVFLGIVLETIKKYSAKKVFFSKIKTIK